MKNPYLNLISAFWRFSDKKHRRRLVLAAFMFVFANVIALTQPLILAKMINEIQGGVNEDSFVRIVVYLVMFMSAIFLFWLLHGPARVIERLASFEATTNYTEYLYETIVGMPLKWHRNHHSGYTIDRMEKSYEAFRHFSMGSYIYIQNTVELLVSFVVMAWIFPGSIAIAVIFAIIVFKMVVGFDKRIISLTEKLNIKNHELMSSFFDYISNISTVLTLNLQKLTQNEFLHRIVKMRGEFKRRSQINELKWFSVSMVVQVIVFLVLLGYMYTEMRSSEVIMMGTMVALFQYTSYFVSTFFNFTYKYEELVLENTDFKIAEPIIADAERYSSVGTLITLPKILKSVQIADLDFTYADDKKRKHHLKNVHINIVKGKNIAFVGESGSGKSTFMTLLRGLEAPDNVSVIVNGEEVNNLSVLSSYSTLIPQEPEIFENTILFNISFGISRATKDVMKAIKMSNFASVLKGLPNGLKSSMKEKGVNLSGGEKQRLALARGIFAAIREKSQIILLDEPTSSVDPKNDNEIYEKILKSFKKACIISSIHKLHLCDKFDEIYVFNKGEVVEIGTYSELLAKKGKFYELWLKQQVK